MIPSRQEVAYRVFGAWQLARFDAAGAQYFDESPRAALRSFFAAILVGPAIFATLMLVHEESPPVDSAAVAMVLLLCYSLLWTAYPLITYRICQEIDREKAFFRYLCAGNWANVIADHLQLAVVLFIVGGIIPEIIAPLVKLAMWVYLLGYAWFIAVSCLKVSGLAAAGLVLLQFVVVLFIRIIAIGILYPEGP